MNLTPVPAPAVEDALHVRLLPPDCVEFSTAQHRYTLSTVLCPLRYKALQKLQLEFGFDVSFKGLIEYHKQMREALKGKDLYDAAILHHNLGKGVTNLAQGRNGGMEICALFFNRDGENQRTYDHALQMDKIRDWEEAGIDASFFFNRAADLVPAFRESYNALTLTLLEGPL